MLVGALFVLLLCVCVVVNSANLVWRRPSPVNGLLMSLMRFLVFFFVSRALPLCMQHSSCHAYSSRLLRKSCLLGDDVDGCRYGAGGRVFCVTLVCCLCFCGCLSLFSLLMCFPCVVFSV